MEQMTNFKLEIEPSETLHTKKGLKWTVLKE